MRIVIDTNVVYRAGYSLKGGIFGDLLARVRGTGHSLHVPWAVVDEATNRQRRRLSEVNSAIDKAVEDLPALKRRGLTRIPKKAIKLVVSEYRDRLVSRLRDAGATLLDYPHQPSHHELARRALLDRWPFNRHKPAEYADCVIWQNVLALAKATSAPDVALVTEDKHFRDGAGSLHPDLRQDLKDSGLLDGRVKLLTLDKLIYDVLGTPGESEAREVLGSYVRKYPAFNWKEAITSRMPEFILSYWRDQPQTAPTVVPSVKEVRERLVREELEISNIAPVDTAPLESGRLAVTVAVTANIGLLRFAYPGSTTQQWFSTIFRFPELPEAAYVPVGQWAGAQLTPILEFARKEFRATVRLTFQPPSGPISVELKEIEET